MAKLGATSFKQTRFGILPREKVIKLEVLGIRRGLLFLQKVSQTHRKLSIALIQKVHRLCFKDILQTEAGKFRTRQVTFSGQEAMHFSQIYEQMTNLCSDVQTRLSNFSKSTNEKFINEVVDLLSWFQHRFVQIHPFIDYNGRLARLFTNFILMRLILPIIEIKIENRKDRQKYIAALQKADNHDYSLLKQMISMALDESLTKVE